MKTNYPRLMLGALVVIGGAILANAQSVVTEPVGVVAAPEAPSARVPPVIAKPSAGTDVSALVAQQRDREKAFIAARKAAQDSMRNATPADIERLKANLREMIRQHQQQQRILAKAIRDAIRARRNPSPPS